MEWIDKILFWHWLIVGIVFIVMEMLILPAAYFLWMGISAIVISGIMAVFPDISFLFQIIIFTIISVVALVFHKRYLKSNPPISDSPNLNRRGDQYVNRVFTLAEAIVNGVGKVKVDDSTWKVSGDDMQTGEKVKVTGVDGTILQVVRAP